MLKIFEFRSDFFDYHLNERMDEDFLEDGDLLELSQEDITNMVENGQNSKLCLIFLQDFPSSKVYSQRINHFLKDINEKLSQ